MISVYKVTNKQSGKCYIGQTKRKVQRRWKEHCNPNGNNHVRYLGFAIQKHSPAAFSVAVLGTYPDQEAAALAEIYFIEWFNCKVPNGYNIEAGGNVRKEVSAATRRLISVKAKGKRRSPATEFKPGPRPEQLGSANPRFGKVPKHAKRILCVQTGQVYESMRHAAEALGCPRSRVSMIANKKPGAIQTRGYTFEYAEAV